MKSLLWVKIWFILTISMIISLLIIIKITNIPLRFSNSISYDAKLNFIHNSNLLHDANILVIGSSMALNNFNGETFKRFAKVKKVANLGSWGLQSSEVVQLIKLIDLTHVDYIIYSTQYVDFQNHVQKNIDEQAVKKYLHNEFSLIPYFITLGSFVNNLNDFLNYKELYLDPNKYSYLGFDSSGGVNLSFDNKYIIKARWENNTKGDYQLSEECFDDLRELSEIAKRKNITLIVVTTPLRGSILNENEDLYKTFNAYVEKLEDLSQKNNFIYINAYNSLLLTDQYFVDKFHLNKEGAIIVSKTIAKKIK